MDINFHPSATETTSGSSDVFQQPNLALVGLFVNVSDTEGILPSLTVVLQHSPDGIAWYNVGNISITRSTNGSSSAAPVALALLADYIRIIWTISGSNNPSFAFSVDVVAHNTAP